jgi:hypothetical protein
MSWLHISTHSAANPSTTKMCNQLMQPPLDAQQGRSRSERAPQLSAAEVACASESP